MSSFSIKTFGCKVSRHDSDVLRSRLLSTGMVEKVDAEVYIIHGCGVTSRAETKAMKYVRGLKREHPEARIILAGCLARSLKDTEFEVLVPDSDPTDLLHIPDDTNFSIVTELTRPLVKIHDGCNQFCTYCIVPHLRGRERSVPVAAVLNMVRHYEGQGYNEIVLTGIHIGRYRDDSTTLPELLKAILIETEIHRIRLSSIEPQEVTDELVGIISETERIARYIHLPLQSGSEDVLERMHRPYRSGLFRNIVSALVKRIPDIGIGTDVIVGFPGETDDDFEDTYRLLEELPVYNIHAFRFSPRTGTPAFGYPDQISGRVKSERMARLQQLRTAKRETFLNRFIGRSQRYLIERLENGIASGTSSNYIHCLTRNPDARPGQEIELTGESIEGEELIAI